MTCTPNVIETKTIIVNTGARGPAGPSPANLIFVDSLLDLPPAVAGVRSIPSGTVLFLTVPIDLAGDRIVAEGVMGLFGSSSETAKLSSTGLIDTPLITSNYSLPMQDIAIECDYAVELDGQGTAALDWRAVNFLNTRKVGNIRNQSNFIMTDSAFLSSSGLVFGGTVGTIGFDGCLFVGRDSLATISVEPDAVITRRFRVIYSSVVSLSGGVAIHFPDTVTIPTEGYILDSVNFSGPGNYLSGVLDDSNSTLFSNCTGIENTKVAGQMYARDNSTPTAMVGVGTYVKLNIPMLPSDENQKYSVTANRLTCEAVIPRRYLVQVTASFTSGNNNIIELGIYDSKLGAVREPSKTKSTANAGGRAENIALHCVVTHSQGDYLELWGTNLSGTTAITPTDVNFLVTAL